MNASENTREIVILLPDHVTINGAADAPEHLRVLNTAKWDQDFIITALTHGVSQKLGDVWSVSKKDTEKLANAHKALEAGDWNQRVQGSKASKLTKLIGELKPEDMQKLSSEAKAALIAALSA